MKNKIKLFFIGFSFLFFLFSCNNNPVEKKENKNDRNKIISQIDSIAQAYYDKGQLVGFAVAVLRDGDTLYNKAFGYSNLEKKIPATEATKVLGMAMVIR